MIINFHIQQHSICGCQFRENMIHHTNSQKIYLKNRGIVIVPGDASAKCGEGYFRISFVCSDEKLQEVIDRMKADGFKY